MMKSPAIGATWISRPSCASAVSAARTGVRDTPKRSARAISSRCSPGAAYRPRISARRASVTDFWRVSNGARNPAIAYTCRSTGGQLGSAMDTLVARATQIIETKKNE